ncbi:MAG: cyclic nucleotide-binding domain-containing protein [Thermodesulfobacteriota bacterium]|nr:cyclic nucleotide-binding domain-containing protein [Thermodesulfobacteriota bacterium]
MKGYKIEGKEIFSVLTPKQVDEISDIAIIKNSEEGEILFNQGEHAKNFHILLEGEVVLELPSSKDTNYENFSLEIERIKGHGVFGPGLLFGMKRFITRARTTKPSKIMIIDSERFVEIIRKNKSEFPIMSYLAKVYFQRYIGAMKEFQQYIERRKIFE